MLAKFINSEKIEMYDVNNPVIRILKNNKKMVIVYPSETILKTIPSFSEITNTYSVFKDLIKQPEPEYDENIQYLVSIFTENETMIEESFTVKDIDK